MNNTDSRRNGVIGSRAILLTLRDLVRFEGENSFLRKTWGSWRIGLAACSAAMFFAMAILLMSIMAATNPARVYPHEEYLASGSGTQVEYYLPYPGVLPDSPLYKVKAARDKVKLWLTFNEEKKVEYELLLADKRINAGVALIDGGKAALGVSTVTKGEKYLTSAVNRAEKLSKAGKDVKSLLGKLINASAKHEEVVVELIGKTNGSEKKVLEETFKESSFAHQKASQALLEAK